MPLFLYVCLTLIRVLCFMVWVCCMPLFCVFVFLCLFDIHMCVPFCLCDILIYERGGL